MMWACVVSVINNKNIKIAQQILHAVGITKDDNKARGPVSIAHLQFGTKQITIQKLKKKKSNKQYARKQ